MIQCGEHEKGSMSLRKDEALKDEFSARPREQMQKNMQEV